MTLWWWLKKKKFTQKIDKEASEQQQRSSTNFSLSRSQSLLLNAKLYIFEQHNKQQQRKTNVENFCLHFRCVDKHFYLFRLFPFRICTLQLKRQDLIEKNQTSKSIEPHNVEILLLFLLSQVITCLVNFSTFSKIGTLESEGSSSLSHILAMTHEK